jgi:hypothetical protein
MDVDRVRAQGQRLEGVVMGVGMALRPLRGHAVAEL